MDGSNVAIYLDFENLAISAENVYPSKDKPMQIEPVVDFSTTKGNISLRKAYADWSKDIFSRYQGILMDQGFELIHLPETNSQGKNGADVRLAIDVLEDIFMYPEIETLVIGSGDSDFIPLIQRVKARNKDVVVLGFEHSVSRLVKRNSGEFKSLEELLGEPEEESPSSDLMDDPDLNHGRELLVRYINSRTQDGPVLMATLKQHLLRLDPSFSEKELGFSSFKKFLKSMLGDVVEKINLNNETLPMVYLQDVAPKMAQIKDSRENAKHFLSKKLRYQKNPSRRIAMANALIMGMIDTDSMSMTQMFEYIEDNINNNLPKTEIRKYINTLFTGGAFKVADVNINGPLLARPFMLMEVINSAENLDQIYIHRISEILQNRYANLETGDILELLI